MTTTITASGADATLWHVAARELGDPLAAVRIAYLSGLPDPWITGMPTLTIPAQAGPDTGGLPSPGLLP